MKRKIMLIAFLAIFAAFIPTWLYVNSLLPEFDGTFKAPTLKKKVVIHRDKFDIPHIYAHNERDANVALGYLTASERLFQMEMARRIGSGRLSELFGEKVLHLDILLRQLRIKKTAELYLKNNKLSSELEASMDAYLEGVEQYIKTQPLPIEFKILGIKPEPFTKADMLAVSGYMALSFAEGIIADTLYSDLFSNFPREMVEDLRPRKHLADIKGKPTSDGPMFSLKKQQWFKQILSSLEILEDRFGLYHGSNSWVMAPKRSKSGAALLASDPHIAFSSPSVWYEAHIKTPHYELYGHYVPLVPFALLGHKRDGGWALTMSEADDLDIYLEKINPKNPKQVMYKNRWVNMEIYDEVIKIKGQADKVIQVKVTPHGPLLNNTEFGVKGQSVSIKWAYHHPDNHVAQTFYELAHAKTTKDYVRAISHAAAPGLNISFVDNKGKIGWHVMGKIPHRRKGIDSMRMLDGASGKDEYLGYIPFKDNPHLYNPKSGLIVSANFKPQKNSLSGKYEIQGYWQPPARYYRIHKLLAQKEKWNLEELKKVQTDQYADAYTKVLPKLLHWVTTHDNQMENSAIKYLKKWDGHSDVNSIASTIYHKWVYYLVCEILDDQLGETRFKSYARIMDVHLFYQKILEHPKSRWWDDVTTKDLQETPAQIVTRAWSRTMKVLKKKLGSDIAFWQWGNVHKVEYQHFFGRQKPMNYFFNVGPFPSGGGNGQVDNMGYPFYQEEFTITRGPSTRRLIDFAHPEKSWGIIPTGNSGNPQSKYYDDQAQMFLDGKYRRQLLDEKDVIKESIGTITLKPQL